MTWRQGSELIELTLPRGAPLPQGALQAAQLAAATGGRLGGGGGGVSVLRGVLPRTREEPLTLELAGTAALYAQCVDGL